MNTSAASLKQPESEPLAPQGKPWSLRARIFVSALLLFQVCAVLYGPLSFPPTITTDAVRPIFRPYTGMTYQGNSYKFFSPDPGPSHLIRYEFDLENGEREAGVFPNLDQQWPRLLYHRHFMLTEHINMNMAPPEPNEPIPTDWAQIKFGPGQLKFARSYADHMLHEHNEQGPKARSVTLWLVEHLIPSPDQVVRGMKLNDRTLYRERKLGSFAANP